MPLEAVVLVPVLNKLISLGLSTWKAREDHDLTADDVKAVQSLLDTGNAVGALVRKDPSAASIAVRHFALVTRAFGEAFQRHWYGNPHFVPPGGGGDLALPDGSGGRPHRDRALARAPRHGRMGRAALAIGSSLEGERGIQAKDPQTLRSKNPCWI